MYNKNILLLCYLFIIATIFVFPCNNAISQESTSINWQGEQHAIKLTTEVEKKIIKCNESFFVKDSILVDDTANINWEPLKETNSSAAYIFQNNGEDLSSNINRKIINTQILNITPRLPGKYTIAERVVEVTIADGKTLKLTFPAQEVTFLSVFEGSTITPQEASSITSSPKAYRFISKKLLLIYTLGFISIVLLIIIANYYIKKYLTQNIKEIVIPIIPADIEAIKEINIIKKELIKATDLSPLYIKSEFVLRRYLERQFKIPVLESTSEELCKILNKKNDDLSSFIIIINQQMKRGDFIKFAKQVPSKDDVESNMNLCESIIEEMRKKEEIIRLKAEQEELARKQQEIKEKK